MIESWSGWLLLQSRKLAGITFEDFSGGLLALNGLSNGMRYKAQIPSTLRRALFLRSGSFERIARSFVCPSWRSPRIKQ